MNATNALEALIGNALFLGTPLAVTDWSLALFLSEPDETGAGGTEVGTLGTGYARLTVPASAAHWVKAPDQDSFGRTIYRNAADLQFPVPLTPWGDIRAIGLYQTHTLCLVAPLTTVRSVLAGDLGPTIVAGELEIAIG